MGLLGSAIWIGILLLGVGGLVWTAFRGRAGRRTLAPEERAEIAFWAAMLLATWVNSSLGVLMEGPVLGIWFWFALGFGSARVYRIFAVPGDSQAKSLELPHSRPVRPAVLAQHSVGLAR
jgi:hypothetical protein